ncbi:hypothetical protein E2320_014109, partial [Naja naja]
MQTPRVAEAIQQQQQQQQEGLPPQVLLGCLSAWHLISHLLQVEEPPGWALESSRL